MQGAYGPAGVWSLKARALSTGQPVQEEFYLQDFAPCGPKVLPDVVDVVVLVEVTRGWY